MRHTCLLVVLFVSVCGWAQTTSTFINNDGNQLLENCGALVRHADAGFTAATNTSEAHWCVGYISGFREGFDAMAMVSTKTYEGYLTLKSTYICFPNEHTIGQDARVLVKFLSDHPERLHEAARILVLAAFEKAYPCEQKPKPKPKVK
jgi:hypothetical protein